MKVLMFKTDIKECQDVDKISAHLDRINSIQNWEVDTKNSEKYLTVRGKNIDAADILKAVKKGGFKAVLIGETATN